MKVAAAPAALFVASWAAIAGATSGDSLGLGPRDMALGLSVAARPVGAAAAFHNPAALAVGAATFGARGPARPDDTLVELGFVYAHPVVHAHRLDDGTSVPLAAEPEDTTAAVVGARADVGALFGRPGIDFGLLLFVPAGKLFDWSIHPDERVEWLFLTDRTQHLGAHAAFGWRVVPCLSVGAGLRVLFDAETFTTARVTEVERNAAPGQGDSSPSRAGEPALDVRTRLGEDVTVYGRAAPTIGLLMAPLDEALRLGVTYRGELYVDDWGWTRIQGVPGAGDLGYVHRFAHYYEPHTVVASVAGRPLRPLWLSADVAWAKWSDGLTANYQALGPGRFGDTVTVSFGASWRASSAVEVRGGYRWAPSPFDDFGGPTNLLDADSHVASIGGEVELGSYEGVAFRVAWAARAAILVAREERKDPRRFPSDGAFLANEGVRPYRYGGTVPGASLSLEASW